MSAPTHPRYSNGAILLHWAIAALIVCNIVLGVTMRDAAGPARLGLLHYHKSIGLSVLLLSVVRICWRLAYRPPALPADMARWERALARTVHIGLYVIMLGLPLTGWMMVSASAPTPPIRLFGVLPWPWFPLVRDLAPASAKTVHGLADQSHIWLGRVTLALIILHVAGALKHMMLRDGVAWRMLPLRLLLPSRRARQEKGPA